LGEGKGNWGVENRKGRGEGRKEESSKPFPSTELLNYLDSIED
jgi:hypothetical protein